ncbi:stage V sporulation protein S [Paenibacillus sp. FSL K6-1566]|uniref:stage V sporulation protein S n=1 Tax=Paenibacillus sp. FSL K6-1566 TaxID=2954515 RepID=UPI003100D5DD
MIAICRISAHANPVDAAQRIANVIRKCGVIELQAVGDNAISKAVKAVAIAQDSIAQNADMVCTPLFMEAYLKGEKVTGMKIVVENR